MMDPEIATLQQQAKEMLSRLTFYTGQEHVREWIEKAVEQLVDLEQQVENLKDELLGCECES